MLEYENERCRELLTNKKWQQGYLKSGRKLDLKPQRIGLKTSSEILKQCVRIVEGGPILLTEKQWDWLYYYFLDTHEDTFFFYHWRSDLLETNETEYEIGLTIGLIH